MKFRLKSLLLMVIDVSIVFAVPFIALFLRFEGAVAPKYLDTMLGLMPEVIFVRLSTFYFFGLYHRIWRYASVNEILAIIWAVSASSLVLTVYFITTGAELPRSVHVLSWFINIVLIGGSRLFIRVLYHIRQNYRQTAGKVLIIGAGDAGAMIAREILNRYQDTRKIVGFIDDDPKKYNQMIYGVSVLGTRKDIVSVAKEHQINEIIIAMPSAGGRALREILNECKQTNCQVKTVPGLYELIDGQVSIRQLRDVNLEDLLRREPVKLDVKQIVDYLSGKRVLVTGAGGSIGSELCRQIAKMNPTSLILLGKGENSIYEIHRELAAHYPAIALHPVIADVRDEGRISSVFRQYKPQVVFHAAAHKHVPLMEVQPEEAVRNNIFGTKILAEAADRHNIEIFIMISTDKAVNPTSVMGATKRVAELIIQNMNDISETRFAAVRFGNVLGSRGSVIPIFKKQIAEGGPVTVTHPDMKRYFMTIPEASQLVLQAGAMAQGGEVFVLDMGEPVKILDMANDLIKLSGLAPNKDIEIKFTGLRPGEKLFEELLTAEEGATATVHEKIYIANLKKIDEHKLQNILLALQQASEPQIIIDMLTNFLPSYKNARAKYCPVEVEAKKAVNTESINFGYQMAGS